jgi:hypothetical protein
MLTVTSRTVRPRLRVVLGRVIRTAPTRSAMYICGCNFFEAYAAAHGKRGRAE